MSDENQSAEQLAGHILQPFYENYGLSYHQNVTEVTQSILRYSAQKDARIKELEDNFKSAVKGSFGASQVMAAENSTLRKRVEELEKVAELSKRLCDYIDKEGPPAMTWREQTELVEKLQAALSPNPTTGGMNNE